MERGGFTAYHHRQTPAPSSRPTDHEAPLSKRCLMKGEERPRKGTTPNKASLLYEFDELGRLSTKFRPSPKVRPTTRRGGLSPRRLLQRRTTHRHRCAASRAAPPRTPGPRKGGISFLCEGSGSRLTSTSPGTSRPAPDQHGFRVRFRHRPVPYPQSHRSSAGPDRSLVGGR